MFKELQYSKRDVRELWGSGKATWGASGLRNTNLISLGLRRINVQRLWLKSSHLGYFRAQQYHFKLLLGNLSAENAEVSGALGLRNIHPGSFWELKQHLGSEILILGALNTNLGLLNTDLGTHRPKKP